MYIVKKETNTGIPSHRQARQKIYEILSGNWPQIQKTDWYIRV